MRRSIFSALLLCIVVSLFGCGGGGEIKEAFESSQLRGDSSGEGPGTIYTTDKILFWSSRSTGSGPGFYSMKADGTALTLLYSTASTDYSYNHRFYSNGAKILTCDSTGNIDSIDIVGQTRTTILADGGFTGSGWYDPAISPDGTKIVYFEYPNGLGEKDFKINISNIDGSNPQTLVDIDGFATYPSFSPDGTKIIYSSRTAIYTVPISGGTPTQLLTNSGLSSPVFTKDGTKIAFITDDQYLKIANADGSGVQTVYSSDSDNLGQILRFLDNSTIVFQKDTTGDFILSINVIKIDGTGLAMITSEGSNHL